MSWNLGNVLARNRHVHRSIFRRRNGSRIVCWLFDLYCGLRLLCLRLWHSNGAWARMVAFWNFGCGRGVVCHDCMARPCCSHRHHVLFVFRSKSRAKAAQLIEMAKSGERGRFNKGNYQSRRIPCREVARTRKTLRRQATVGHVVDNIFSERAALRRLTSMMSRRGGRKVPPRRVTRRHRMEPISQRAIPGLKVRTGIQKMPGRDASAAFPAARPVLQHGFLASRWSRKSGGSRQSSTPSARRDASRS